MICIKYITMFSNADKANYKQIINFVFPPRQRIMASVRRKQNVYTKASEASEKTPLLGGKSGPVFKKGHVTDPPVPPSATPSLSTALVKTFWFMYLVSLAFKFISDVLQFASPVLLG